MRLLLVSQYFFTPEQAGSPRILELAGRLAGDGHEVTLVTGMLDNSTRQVPPAYRGRLRVRERIGGMDVLRVWTTTRYQGSTRRRLLHYASFNATSMAALLEGRRFDCVLATSPPLTVGLSGWLLSRLFGARFLFEVRDLWPMAAVEVGALSPGRALRAAEALERFLYRKADRILAVTPGLARHLVGPAAVPSEKVRVVTNGFDPSAFESLPDPAEGRRQIGVPADFLVVQAGSIGPSDRLEVLIDAAARLRDDPGIRFLVVGEGEGRESLQRRAAELRLSSVEFRPPVPRSRVKELYGAADLLVCHVPGFYADIALPNRFLDYLGTGRPILTSGSGDMAEALRGCGSGEVVPPEDPDAMAAAIRRLRARKVASPGRGRAREAARQFGWDAVYERYREAVVREPGERADRGVIYAHRGGQA